MTDREFVIKTMHDLWSKYEQLIEQDMKDWEATKALIDNHVEPVPFDETVPEMDEDKQWAVVYTYHDHDEDFYVGVIPVNAPEMSEALNKANEPLQKAMWENRWSDYIVVGTIMLKEVH